MEPHGLSRGRRHVRDPKVRLGASRCRVVQVNTGQNIPSFVSVTESASFAAQRR
jgi:hypothetical protein